jgi:uncharacterized protein (TIGR02466 family)
MKHELHGLFPSPVYVAKYIPDRELDVKQNATDIEDIIKGGFYTTPPPPAHLARQSKASHIFDTKLHNIKKCIEEHIKEYVREVINPAEELEYYITQSWLNITKPEQEFHRHRHGNSIISGVFYVKTWENDSISFHDMKAPMVQRIEIIPKEFQVWNSAEWYMPVENNTILLFPSWLEHGVNKNPTATGDRISIAFNVFAKGIFGSGGTLNELIV